MNRNTEKLLAAARLLKDRVVQTGRNTFRVPSSDPSHEPYIVVGNNGSDHTSFSCNCKFGNPYQTGYGRKESGCKHTLAVVIHLEELDGRTVTAQSGEESAKRQHRPKLHLGQDLWATSRNS